MCFPEQQVSCFLDPPSGSYFAELRKDFLEANVKGRYTLVNVPLELVPKMWNSIEMVNFMARKLVRPMSRGFHIMPRTPTASETSISIE